MKFSLISAATLAIAGLASAASLPCDKVVSTEGLTCQALAAKYNVDVNLLAHANGLSGDCDSALKKVSEVCVQSHHTHSKRCLAEKKKAEEKAAQEKAAQEAAAKEAAAAEESSNEEETTEEPAEEEKTTSSSSGSGPSPQAVPASEAGSLRIVNKANENCAWYYVITSADSGCADVAAKNGITTEQLYSWNKNLHSVGVHECDNLDDGKAYCVGL